MLTNAMLVAINHEVPQADTSELATAWWDPGTGRVHLVGEIDFFNARRIFDAVERGADLSANLSVDLTRLEFLDCSALHFISELADKLHAERRRLLLLFPRRIVQRALEVTYLVEHPGLTLRNAASADRVTSTGEWVRLA